MAGGRLSSGRCAGGCVFVLFVVMVVWVGLVSGWWSVEQWSLCCFFLICFCDGGLSGSSEWLVVG